MNASPQKPLARPRLWASRFEVSLQSVMAHATVVSLGRSISSSGPYSPMMERTTVLSLNW
eukprot:7069210-Prymnesium_polylepis.1